MSNNPSNDGDGRGQKRSRSDDNVEEAKAPTRDRAEVYTHQLDQLQALQQPQTQSNAQQHVQNLQGRIQELQGQLQDQLQQQQHHQLQPAQQQSGGSNALGLGNSQGGIPQGQSTFLSNSEILAQIRGFGNANVPASADGNSASLGGGNLSLGGGVQGNMPSLQQQLQQHQLANAGGSTGGTFTDLCLAVVSNPAPAPAPTFNLQQAFQNSSVLGLAAVSSPAPAPAPTINLQQALQNVDGNLLMSLLSGAQSTGGLMQAGGLIQGLQQLQGLQPQQQQQQQQQQSGPLRPDPPTEVCLSGGMLQLLQGLTQGAAPTPTQDINVASLAPQQAAARPPARRPRHNQSHLVDNSRTRSVLLYVPTDDDSLSPYQAFARQQIELFEAQEVDAQTGAQGRNKPVQLGQVGIRCIHCADLHPKLRTRAAVYYPSRLTVLYQAAQNIVNVHLPELCESIPEDIRARLITLDNKRSSVGGGKNYWSDTAQIQGVGDTSEGGLRFKENNGGDGGAAAGLNQG